MAQALHARARLFVESRLHFWCPLSRPAWRSCSSTWQGALPLLPFFFALSCAMHVRAAVWGYIDEQGRPHIATEKLDDRYQLFFKGKTTQELAAKPQGGEAFE